MGDVQQGVICADRLARRGRVETRPKERRDVAVTEDESGGLVVELRSERSGTSKSGRVYQLTVKAQDLAGNEVTASATCVVPHDKGKEK